MNHLSLSHGKNFSTKEGHERKNYRNQMNVGLCLANNTSMRNYGFCFVFSLVGRRRRRLTFFFFSPRLFSALFLPLARHLDILRLVLRSFSFHVLVSLFLYFLFLSLLSLVDRQTENIKTKLFSVFNY